LPRPSGGRLLFENPDGIGVTQLHVRPTLSVQLDLAVCQDDRFVEVVPRLLAESPREERLTLRRCRDCEEFELGEWVAQVYTSGPFKRANLGDLPEDAGRPAGVAQRCVPRDPSLRPAPLTGDDRDLLSPDVHAVGDPGLKVMIPCMGRLAGVRRPGPSEIKMGNVTWKPGRFKRQSRGSIAHSIRQVPQICGGPGGHRPQKPGEREGSRLARPDSGSNPAECRAEAREMDVLRSVHS
jgi:hypothetical protein